MFSSTMELLPGTPESAAELSAGRETAARLIISLRLTAREEEFKPTGMGSIGSAMEFTTGGTFLSSWTSASLFEVGEHIDTQAWITFRPPSQRSLTILWTLERR